MSAEHLKALTEAAEREIERLRGCVRYEMEAMPGRIAEAEERIRVLRDTLALDLTGATVSDVFGGADVVLAGVTDLAEDMRELDEADSLMRVRLTGRLYSREWNTTTLKGAPDFSGDRAGRYRVLVLVTRMPAAADGVDVGAWGERG